MFATTVPITNSFVVQFKTDLLYYDENSFISNTVLKNLLV